MTINPDGRRQSLGAIPGSREPDPSCTGSGPSGFDPERIASLDAARYSPNLRAWLRKQTRDRFWRSFPAVYRSEDGTRWIGWLDADPEYFIGSKLWRCVCDGAKAEVGCWTFPVTDLTEEPDFWPRYAEIGRCHIDPEHRRGFLNEEKTRWLTDGETRSCLWCGNHAERLRRWTEEVKRERWEPASGTEAQRATTVEQGVVHDGPTGNAGDAQSPTP